MSVTASVNEVVSTWKDYIDGLGLVAHYEPKNSVIVIDYIKVPASRRRQGIATQILDEIKELATSYSLPVLIQPDDVFGTPKPVLINLYAQNGFAGMGDFMRWEP